VTEMVRDPFLSPIFLLIGTYVGHSSHSSRLIYKQLKL